jgi:hypothetical protein
LLPLFEPQLLGDLTVRSSDDRHCLTFTPIRNHRSLPKQWRPSFSYRRRSLFKPTRIAHFLQATHYRNSRNVVQTDRTAASDNYRGTLALGRLKAGLSTERTGQGRRISPLTRVGRVFTVQSVQGGGTARSDRTFWPCGHGGGSRYHVRPETVLGGHVHAWKSRFHLVTYIEAILGSVETLCCAVTPLRIRWTTKSLKEQLDRLPVICRFQYGAVANMILNSLTFAQPVSERLFRRSERGATASASPDVQLRVAIIESNDVNDLHYWSNRWRPRLVVGAYGRW